MSFAVCLLYIYIYIYGDDDSGESGDMATTCLHPGRVLLYSVHKSGLVPSILNGVICSFVGRLRGSIKSSRQLDSPSRRPSSPL